MHWGRRILLVLLAVACACCASAMPSKFGNSTMDSNQNVYALTYLSGTGAAQLYKISSTGTVDWTVNQNPPTGYQYDQTAAPWVRVDSLGNSFALCQILNTSANTRGFEMFKLSSSGTFAGGAIYMPGGQWAQIIGLVINSNGSPFAAFRYGTTSSQVCNLSGIWEENTKLDVSTVQQVYYDSEGSVYTLATDIIADGSGNVYVGCIGTSSDVNAANGGALLVFQFSSSNEWMWTYVDPLPYSEYQEFFGSLTVDSADRLTYVEPVCDSTGTVFSLAALQITVPTPVGHPYWTGSFAVPDANGPVESMVDSSGDIYVLGNQVLGNNYYLTKLSPAGALLWNENYNNPNSVQSGVYSFAQGVLGTVEVLEDVYINGQGNGTIGVGIQLFSPSIGAPSGSYSYTGGRLDVGYTIFASPTISGSFDVIGIGVSGGTTLYPLAFQIANSAFSWIHYL